MGSKRPGRQSNRKKLERRRLRRIRASVGTGWGPRAPRVGETKTRITRRTYALIIMASLLATAVLAVLLVHFSRFLDRIGSAAAKALS